MSSKGEVVCRCACGWARVVRPLAPDSTNGRVRPLDEVRTGHVALNGLNWDAHVVSTGVEDDFDGLVEPTAAELAAGVNYLVGYRQGREDTIERLKAFLGGQR